MQEQPQDNPTGAQSQNALRQLYTVAGNSQRLDGGSMFGNCPRAVWQRWCEPDELHRIPLACRALLVREPGPQGRNILFETGIGTFFAPHLRDRYGVQEEEHILIQSLAALGLAPKDIDVIVLSHLHFDHAGGVLHPWQHDTPPRLLFDQAAYVVGETHWQRACNPHPRDRASFIPELQPLLENTGRLERVTGSAMFGGTTSRTLGQGYALHFSQGHTPGLMLAQIDLTPSDHETNQSMLFAGDLIPGMPWIHLPITMGYDRYPEQVINEKKELLQTIKNTPTWLFFTHDADISACRVIQNEKGRYVGIDATPTLTGQLPQT